MNYQDTLKKDKQLWQHIHHHNELRPGLEKNIPWYLASSIIGQQLSTKVARVLRDRFLNLCDGKKPSAKKMAALSQSALRSAGISNAKAAYIQNVAIFALEHGLQAASLSKMRDEEVIGYLTQIKGVGRWTAEMVLIFAMGRPDVFAIDDLGLRNAVIKIYNLQELEPKQQRINILSISEKWKPFRSYASLHLWHFLDNPSQ